MLSDSTLLNGLPIGRLARGAQIAHSWGGVILGSSLARYPQYAEQHVASQVPEVLVQLSCARK